MAIADASSSSVPHSKFVTRDFVPWATRQPATVSTPTTAERSFA